MSELFREIQEDMRRERLDRLWQKVGRFAIWGSVIIVSLTTIYVVWNNHKAAQAELKTTELLRGMELVEAADYKGAVKIFSDLSNDETSPHYKLAMLKKAQAQELSGDTEGAKKTYQHLSDTKSEFGELARMHSDSIDSEKSVVFDQSFKEAKAWDAFSKGDKETAGNLFLELANDAKTSPSLARRSIEALRYIAPEKLVENKVTK